jgi:hypothetical protein
MRKMPIFLLGFILGIVFTIVFAVIIGDSDDNSNGMTLFEQPSECISVNSFKVVQVVDDNYALAREIEWTSLGSMPTDLVVLITNDNGEYYYDDQEIKIPKGQCARQIGIYKYRTVMESEKTVPIVKLMDK